MKKGIALFFNLCFFYAVYSQTPMLDISMSKLPNGIFLVKDYNLVNGDTVYKKFEKYQTAIEKGDSVLYVEEFNINRNWLLSRYLISGKERIPSGWQSEYDIHGYKLYDRYCDVASGDCNLYKKYNYFPNGNVMALLTYYKKKLNGISLFYYNDGRLKHSLEYVNGKLWNINAYYDQNGNVLDPGTFCDGTGLVYVYASNGKLIKMKWYKDGKVQKEKNLRLP